MPSWYTEHGITKINFRNPEDQYPQVCFNYIHFNPMVGGLVKKLSEWNYSSLAEFTFQKTYQVVNRKRVEEFGLKLPADIPV